MISERYLCNERVRISWRNVLAADPAMAVRSLLMNAVFFFNEESRELSTGKTSMESDYEQCLQSERQTHLPLSPAQARSLEVRSSPLRLVSTIVVRSNHILTLALSFHASVGDI